MRAFRVVLVGAGGMGRAWAGTIADNPEVSLVGWVDLVKDRVANAAEALGLANVAVEEDLATARRPPAGLCGGRCRSRGPP